MHSLTFDILAKLHFCACFEPRKPCAACCSTNDSCQGPSDFVGKSVGEQVFDSGRLTVVAQADEGLLVDLKAMQLRLRASDEAATAALNEYVRANVESALSRAIQVMQIRGQRRDVSPAITVSPDSLLAP